MKLLYGCCCCSYTPLSLNQLISFNGALYVLITVTNRIDIPNMSAMGDDNGDEEPHLGAAPLVSEHFAWRSIPVRSTTKTFHNQSLFKLLPALACSGDSNRALSLSHSLPKTIPITTKPLHTLTINRQIGDQVVRRRLLNGPETSIANNQLGRIRRPIQRPITDAHPMLAAHMLRHYKHRLIVLPRPVARINCNWWMMRGAVVDIRYYHKI